MSVKDNFIQHLQAQFPGISQETMINTISDQLICPHRITLSKNTLTKLQSEIKQLYALRSWSEKNLSAQYETTGLPKPANYSVCTSFDFHLVNGDQPKLIEINTNAAFLALGLTLYDFWKIQPATNFTWQKLVEMFREEAKLVGQKEINLAIMDEKPSEQRLFIEFLVYQEAFKKNNIPCSIIDVHQAADLKPGTLIYNRYTDFYLKEPQSAQLKALYTEGKLHLSPTPYEYFMLGDKQRLSDWQKQNELPVPESLLKIYDLAEADREQVWNERKKLFFKPKASFGSKQAYNGASMSRKVFDEAFAQGFVAQEYAPPPEVDVLQDGQNLRLKYDLRCYAYKDELQLVIARLYQGQTTNLKTIGGGFAIVDFV
ncbi:hypothetical protein [Pseudobdellovibrio sp. HCB154]|uniref:hypothetical protein n=1 Tax=Pseudobdellovibrio sp. HCB154 TaxID=3386277 RepID=UPI0039175B48